MAAPEESAESAEAQPVFRRVRGLVPLVVLVLVGLGVPGFLKWSVPRLEARAARMREEAPSEPEGRLSLALEFLRPRIHTAMIQARFSSERPWYVTHQVEGTDATQPEIWGIDLSDLEQDMVAQEGLVARLVLPAPEVLEHGRLGGDKAQGVPYFKQGAQVPDPSTLACERLVRYLERITHGLAGDIPGARLEVQVGDVRSDA